MATLTELSTLASTTAFQDKVRASVTKAALDIVGETPIANSDKREALGVKILQGSYNILVWSHAVAAQANLAAPADSDINTAVASIWNDMAGITTA